MKTFEDYLEEQHAKQYVGTKDQIKYSLENWLAYLDTQEVIDYAEDWGKLITNS